MIYIFFGVFIITALAISILTASGKVHGTATLAKILKSSIVFIVVGCILSFIPRTKIISSNTYQFSDWSLLRSWETEDEFAFYVTKNGRDIWLTEKSSYIDVEYSKELSQPEIEIRVIDNRLRQILFFEQKTIKKVVIRVNDESEYAKFKVFVSD